MHVVENLVPAGVWAADNTHSYVGFEVEHQGIAVFRAEFASFEIELASGADSVGLRGSVRADSVEIRDETLRAHVLSPDFLDVERYPEIGFRSTELERDTDDLVVRGELTVKGTTKAIEARGTITSSVEDPFGNERVALAARTVIDRTAYGLNFQIAMPDGTSALANEVALIVSLELVKGT